MVHDFKIAVASAEMYLYYYRSSAASYLVRCVA